MDAIARRRLASAVGVFLKGNSMLVLGRKQSEVIEVGDDITITVVRIGPESVRLGIDAPADVVILRRELTERGADDG